MKAYAWATISLVAVGALALAACGSGGDSLGPETTTLKPAGLGGIEGT